MGQAVIQGGVDSLVQQKNLQLGPGRRVPALVCLQGFIQGFEHSLLLLSGHEKNLSHPLLGIRGDKIAVPLSFLTFPAAIGAEPGAITPRAPGCTSHLAAAGPLSAGEGPSLFVGWALLFPFLALVTEYYISISPRWCQVRPAFLSPFFSLFRPVNPRLTNFQLLFLVNQAFFWYLGLTEYGKRGSKMELNERIALARKQAGLSQEQLGEKLGVSRQAVSKWESGGSLR